MMRCLDSRLQNTRLVFQSDCRPIVSDINREYKNLAQLMYIEY